MVSIVTQGDAAHLLLPDECVDTVITSPPYFGLRSYQDGGEHYVGQIGDEATPGEYLDALIACTAEWMRVLKPGGSIFVNLGDRYDDQKSLMDLPHRYAIRARDELRLIKRAEIVWAKPNGLPESVTDRVRRSHEQVFHLVKQPRYYSAVDEVRESYGPNKAWGDGSKSSRSVGGAIAAVRGTRPDQQQTGLGTASREENPLGKLPGSVWTIPTAPLQVPDHLGVDHFAAYPPELVRRIIAGWSPRQVCTACGEGRRPVVSKGPLRVVAGAYKAAETTAAYGNGQRHGTNGSTLGHERDTTITGYACACPDTTAPTTPGVIVDPFGGTGTTALVADVLGRVGISVDLSSDYCRLARWRTTDPAERARAMQVTKPPVQVDGQLGLFEGAAAGGLW